MIDYKQREQELLAELEAVRERMAEQEVAPTKADIGRLVMVRGNRHSDWFGPLVLEEAGRPGYRFAAGASIWNHAKLYHGPFKLNMTPHSGGHDYDCDPNDLVVVAVCGVVDAGMAKDFDWCDVDAYCVIEI